MQAALRAFGRVTVLFVKKSKYIPESYGGVEVSTHGLCEILKRRFHNVAVVGVTTDRQAQTRSGDPAVCVHHELGYPVYLSARLEDALREAIRHRSPDVVILQEFDLASWRELSSLLEGMPVLFYQQSIYPEWEALYQDPSIRDRKNTGFLCNSSVTRRHAERCGISPRVIPPLFGMEKYKGRRRLGDNVLMVSIQYSKGVDIALEIARRRSDQSFVFVESWSRSLKETDKIKKGMRYLENVSITPSALDLGEVFASAKLLLMPSRLEEGWGRTATEAQLFGIPVLASNKGNLSETVGPGGRTLDPDADLETWLFEFDRITGDAIYFDQLSRAAREHSSRVLAGLGAAVAGFIQAVYSVIKSPQLYVRIARMVQHSL